MKNFVITALLLISAIGFINADEAHGRPLEEVLQEIRQEQGLEPEERINPDKVDDHLLEELGEAVMSLMFSDPKEHEIMDKMMGGEGSESLASMHRGMGYRYLSGDDFLGMGPWRGGMMMGGSMRWPWSGGMMMQPRANSSLAVLLSLQPMPIALGQFYVGDWRKGLLFTAGEALFMGTAMGITMWENRDMMHGDHVGMTPISEWSQLSQVVFFSSLGGYLVTKLIDVIAAGNGAETSSDRVARQFR